jgi:prophage antirepressor-like protein
LYASHFTLWVFDRLNREIRKTTTNISGKTKVIRTIQFDNVKFIDFEHHAADTDTNAFSDLFIMLKSGKYITLSASPSAFREDKIMANQKHHETMAKKMADCIWG